MTTFLGKSFSFTRVFRVFCIHLCIRLLSLLVLMTGYGIFDLNISGLLLIL